MNAAIKEQAAQLEIDRQELSLLEEKIKAVCHMSKYMPKVYIKLVLP